MAIVVSLILCTTYGTTGEAKADMSDTDEDAFILYKYSLMDAKRNRSDEISENVEGNKTTYKYDGHALSCRTVMTGSITETTLEKRAHVVGNFEVSNNSFDITKLSFDFYDEGNRTRVGTITVNDKVIDIKHFDHE